ncbi:hypothetical protein SDC9_19979 [bioreactor metagenome]|uniref:Uncharacterized protein n=1 Tax=bioreactor metagenome TaxID=1076179 RepID=A0A644U5F1_9ZZZZ
MRLPMLLLALFPVFAGNTAQAASAEAAIFESVCLQNAPAFEQSAVERAAMAVRYKGNGILRQGGVSFRPNDFCKVALPVAGKPDDAEVQALAARFAAQTGGTVRPRKSAIGGALWFEVRIGSIKYGIEGGSASNARYFIIAKR